MLTGKKSHQLSGSRGVLALPGENAPAVDSVIATCQAFKQTLGNNMGQYLSSLRYKRKQLVRAHRQAQKAPVPWRHQSHYSTQRDRIQGALSDRHASVQERESQLLQHLVGTSNTRLEAFCYKDLQTARMAQLLNWNKRDFGQVFSNTKLKLVSTPTLDRKVTKFKHLSDDAMLKREIIRYRREDLKSLSKSIPPPAVPEDKQKQPEIQIAEAQFLALGPLNQFILRQQQKFQPKSFPRLKRRSESPKNGLL